MKTSTYLGILAVVLGVSSIATLASGCESDDGGAAAVGEVGQVDSGPRVDSGPAVCVDEPNCSHCSVGISLGNAACLGRTSCCSNAADNGGKSSAQLANEIERCVCQDQCRDFCSGSCVTLSAVTDECLDCARKNCEPQLIACLSDVDTDPACSQSPDAGTDAGNDAGDGGDDAGDGGDGGDAN